MHVLSQGLTVLGINQKWSDVNHHFYHNLKHSTYNEHHQHTAHDLSMPYIRFFESKALAKFRKYSLQRLKVTRNDATQRHEQGGAACFNNRVVHSEKDRFLPAAVLVSTPSRSALFSAKTPESYTTKQDGVMARRGQAPLSN